MDKKWHSGVFFGLHFDIHAQKSDDNIGENLTVDHLVRELSKAKPDYIQCDCKGHMGYTSWPTKIGTPSPGIVADPLRIWCEAAKQLHLPIIMHYSGIWDHAAILAHPEYGRVNSKDGIDGSWTPKDVNSLGRDDNMVCPLSDYAQDLMIPQMIEVIDTYDVDGFWVDGECWASEPCYCDRCTEDFHSKTGIHEIPTAKGQVNWERWLQYGRDNFEAYVTRYTNALHAHKPEVTVCSNWMYTVRHPDDIRAPVDYISGDFPWIWSVGEAELESRFMSNRGTEWELMAWGFTSHGDMSDWTFKSVQALCQEAAVVMSSGGAFLVYDNPERNCRIIPWHMEELGTVSDFCYARKPWCVNTESIPQVVVLHGTKTYYDQSIPLFNTGKGSQPVEGALTALLACGYHCDILCETDFIAKLHRYPCCVIPSAEGVSPSVMERLKDYVESGGRLIVSGLQNNRDFDEILQVADAGGSSKTEGDDKIQPNLTCASGCVVAMGSWRHVKNYGDGGVISHLIRGRDPEIGMDGEHYPAIITRRVGKGMIAGFFGPFLASYSYSRYPRLRKLFAAVMEKMCSGNLCRCEGPEYIHINLRRSGAKTLVHLINTGSATPNTPKNAYIENVPRAGEVTVCLPMARKPASVVLAPGNNPVCWSYQKKVLTAVVESVWIHEILVIE